MGESAFIFVFGFVSLMAMVMGIVVSRILAPHRPDPIKNSPYECGEEILGPARVQVNIRYYLVALVFVVFDVEAIYLFPWAVTYRTLGPLAFWEMAAFLGVLVLGLAYAWKKDALRWY